MPRPPTMDDVAREAGVSRATVSIVYRNKDGVSASTRDRVLAAARRIGYRPNAVAAKLASRAATTLGVFLFDMRNDLTADVFQGIQSAADELGHGLVVGISDPSGQRDERTLNELLGARVDAIILVGAAQTGTALRALNVTTPVVSVTRRVVGLDCVVCDDALGAAMVVDHLVSLGHRVIAHLAPPWRPSDRVAGYEAAMRRADLVPRVVDTGYDRASVAAAVTALMAGNDAPTALFCHNDLTAYAAQDALAELGPAAREDIALVGYDNLRASAMQALSLTSVDQQPVRLGQLGVRTAIARLGDRSALPLLEVLEPRLVIRGSTRKDEAAWPVERGKA